MDTMVSYLLFCHNIVTIHLQFTTNRYNIPFLHNYRGLKKGKTPVSLKSLVNSVPRYPPVRNKSSLQRLKNFRIICRVFRRKYSVPRARLLNHHHLLHTPFPNPGSDQHHHKSGKILPEMFLLQRQVLLMEILRHLHRTIRLIQNRKDLNKLRMEFVWQGWVWLSTKMILSVAFVNFIILD